MIFSTSQLGGINEELAKAYTVRFPYLHQECEDNFQIARQRENSCSFGSLTLVPYNGRTCLYVPAVPLSQHVGYSPPLECWPDREDFFKVIIPSYTIARRLMRLFRDTRLRIS